MHDLSEATRESSLSGFPNSGRQLAGPVFFAPSRLYKPAFPLMTEVRAVGGLHRIEAANLRIKHLVSMCIPIGAIDHE